ncbi:alpha/beta hydrolase family protein [Ornithinibacillus scapharcae]|uniref:S9 family peptidase n=1 Tax=Ornithinibacillus scapharcae TaxID=1147159 RepID=UPI000225B42A|nr:S9 family peptidase [Ornithinibacillus scapharcae]
MLNFSKPTVEQYLRTYVISNFAISKDEKRLVFNTNLNGKMNLWAMDLPDTFPYLFAQKDQSSNFIKFDPEGRYVLTGYDNNGDENYQIYAVSSEGGMPEGLITGDPSEKYYFVHLSDDGKRLYYVTSEGNPSFLNARVRNLEDNSDTLLHEGEAGTTYLAAVSEDENTFVYTRLFANTYIQLFVKDGDQMVSLTPDPDKVHIASSPVFVGEKEIYFTTNYEEEYSYVAKYNLESKSFEKVVQIVKESIEGVQYNKENNYLYFSTEKGVEDILYRYDLTSEKLEELSTPVDVLEKLVVTKAGNLYLLGRSATIPFNIYKSTDGNSWQALTNNRVLGVSQEEMVEPDVVTYKSFDGMEIEALLFKAKPEYSNGYTIFWPHGGPQAAERKMFRAMFQSALNRGYNIFAPNFRGSTGYGSSFVKLVEQDWGHGPRLDCVAGIEWLFENNIADRDKLFLVGGSYGGYMSLLLHGRHSEYFKAVVDIFGVSNLFTFVNSVPPHWKPMMERWVGDPERDKERFITDSPITYLDDMVKPMLVIQGAKDPRVVKEESDQVVAKLKEKGRDVEYLILDDEGHGFSKKENEIKVYNVMLDFLEKHQ